MRAQLRLHIWIVISSVILASAPAWAQQMVSITGRVTDAGGLPLPAATVVVREQNTGLNRSVVTADTGAYTVPNLPPGIYTVTISMSGFADSVRKDLELSAGSVSTLDVTLEVAGLKEAIEVTGQAPLVERRSNTVGGSLSGKEIEDVPSNFRNFTALTQLVPGMTPNPAASTFEGGQVVANGSPSQQNLYLLDGMYNNDDRLGGSQGTQVRLVLDNIAEYQVLSNSYSAEYGGGAGAIINMVTRGGTNNFNGRLYSYFRDDRFNTRGHFLPDDAPKPDERTLQAGFGLGGPIVRNRAHFYFTVERDEEDIAGQKLFPAEAAPLARDFVGAFTVRANNYFGRGDFQINDNNFINARWVLETAVSRGEGFNTNEDTTDAQSWERDWDQLFSMTYTAVLSDRATNVIRGGRIGEELATGAQAFFDSDVNFVGFAGRDPFSIGQRNEHPSYNTGQGGSMVRTIIRTYVFDESFSYFVPSLWGGEHTLKAGGGISFNHMSPRTTVDSGIFTFREDLPYDPNNPATHPTQFDVTVGPPGVEGFDVVSKDRRFYFFVEDRWRARSDVTLNLGVRYDRQRQTPDAKMNFAPRLGFNWDIAGAGTTVVRGGIGKFFAYPPVVLDLTHQQSGVLTQFPTISINAANDPGGVILRPDVVTDSAGNLGVAQLSPAGQAALNQIRDQVLAGSTFNRNPRIDSPDRKLPYQWAWSVGVSRQLTRTSAVTIDYVGNRSRDQLGVIDINEPVNRVRPGVAVFDPDGTLIPAEARATNFARVLQTQTRDEFDGDYNSLQVSFVRRQANRWGARIAYTLQHSNYVGLGNPDARRVWFDNDPRADYGTFTSDRRHVLAASGTWNPWRSLTIAGVLSAISGSAINETVGRDVNGDLDNNDRPIAGIDDAEFPIRSDLDPQGRAVINGLRGPESVLLDMSVRYQVPIGHGLESLDLFYDIFNVLNRENLVNPTGNRASSNFMISTAAQFPRQMQFGLRLRF
ncbi:MAG TPA: TonB-dependent receptor [Vicinamibacterales bacterium]